MASMTPWVRSYSLHDLLDGSFDLFKERFTTLLLAALIPYLLVVIYVVLMRQYLLPGNLTSFSPFDESQLDQLYNQISTPFYTGLGVLNIVSFSIANIVQCRIAASHALGERLSLLASFKKLAKPFWSGMLLLIIGTPIVLAATTIATFIFSIIAGVFALLSNGIGSMANEEVGGIAAIAIFALIFVPLISGFIYLIWTPLLGLMVSLSKDHTGPFTALGDSFKFAGSNFKAHFYSIFLVSQAFFVFLALSVGVFSLFQLMSSHFSPTLTITLGALAGLVGTCMSLGLLACLQVMVYIDGKCRKDNLELRLMARDIGLGEEFEATFSQPGTISAMGYPNYAEAIPSLVGAQRTEPDTIFPDYSSPPPPSVANNGSPEGVNAE